MNNTHARTTALRHDALISPRETRFSFLRLGRSSAILRRCDLKIALLISQFVSPFLSFASLIVRQARYSQELPKSTELPKPETNIREELSKIHMPKINGESSRSGT
jgi:hypothetical protein